MLHDDIYKGETGTQRTLGYAIEIGHPDGGTRCTLDIPNVHTNCHDVLNGGGAGTLLDNVIGEVAFLTVNPNGRAPSRTIPMSPPFVAFGMCRDRPCLTGTMRGGKPFLVLAAEQTSQHSRLICTAAGVFKHPLTDKRPKRSNA